MNGGERKDVSEHLSSSELAYLKSIQQRASLIQTIYNDYVSFLRERYNLDEGAAIDSETGLITRGGGADAGEEAIDD